MITIPKRPIEDAIDDGLIFIEEVKGKAATQVIQSPKVEGEVAVFTDGVPEYPSGSDWQTVHAPIYEPETKTLTIEKGDYSTLPNGDHKFKDGLLVNWLP